jgi:hypothetical protein
MNRTPILQRIHRQRIRRCRIPRRKIQIPLTNRKHPARLQKIPIHRNSLQKNPPRTLLQKMPALLTSLPKRPIHRMHLRKTPLLLSLRRTNR